MWRAKFRFWPCHLQSIAKLLVCAEKLIFSVNSRPLTAKRSPKMIEINIAASIPVECIQCKHHGFSPNNTSIELSAANRFSIRNSINIFINYMFAKQSSLPISYIELLTNQHRQTELRAAERRIAGIWRFGNKLTDRTQKAAKNSFLFFCWTKLMSASQRKVFENKFSYFAIAAVV